MKVDEFLKQCELDFTPLGIYADAEIRNIDLKKLILNLYVKKLLPIQPAKWSYAQELL